MYVKDTKSSNGTYVNDERLSQSGVESDPHELHTGARKCAIWLCILDCSPHYSLSLSLSALGDRLKLGVDVVENNTASHKCVQFTVSIHVPAESTATRTPPPPSLPSENDVPISVLTSGGVETLVNEVRNEHMYICLCL